MALSDNDSRKEKRSTKNRNLYDSGKAWWSDNQKLEAVKTWLVTGNLAMTGRMLKIPEDTMRRWHRTEWWKTIEGELKVQDDLMLSARLKKIVEKSFDAVEDRLENGDWVYDQKTGQLRRKHVSMRDAHKVAIDLMDKREKLLRGEIAVVSEEAVDTKLAKLAEQFASMVNKKITPPTDVVDVDVKPIKSEEQSGSAQGESTPFQGDEQEFESPDPLQE